MTNTIEAIQPMPTEPTLAIEESALRTFGAAVRIGAPPCDGDLAAHIPLESRATYLSWVDRWKDQYRATAEAIRACKRAARDPEAPNRDYERDVLRHQATALLALRRAGKRESWQRATAARRLEASA